MIAQQELEARTQDLRDRRITEDKYLRATGEYWRREGRKIFRAWRARLPDWVAPEDVEQEMLTNVLYSREGGKWVRRVDLFDPSRSASLVAFVLFGARTRTRRAVHQMRGARIHGNEGKNAGHYEATFSRISERRSRGRGEDTGKKFDPCDLVPVFKTQDAQASVREILDDAMRDSGDLRESLALRCLRDAGGDPEDASERLFGSFAARVECGLDTVEAARRLVGQALRGAVGVDVEELAEKDIVAA